MVTANKATTDVRLPAQAETYLAELSFYDSTHGNRGPRATSVKFTTAAAPSKKKKVGAGATGALPQGIRVAFRTKDGALADPLALPLWFPPLPPP